MKRAQEMNEAHIDLTSEAAGSAVSASASSSCALTYEQKQKYAADDTLPIPLTAIVSECRLDASACSSSVPAKNCAHNLHCTHGLGYEKSGIWDVRSPWLALLAQTRMRGMVSCRGRRRRE
jgi:hypothetical protein